MHRITLDPQVPLALWVPLALAIVGLLAWYAVASRSRLSRGHRPVVLALMSLAAAVPLAILLNPTWLDRIAPPPGKPRLAILVDRSDSMATRDMEGDRSRYEIALETAEGLRERLGERYEIDLSYFAADSSLSPDEPSAKAARDSSSTDLAGPVDDVLVEDRPQGQAIVLLSDGIHNAAGGIDRLRQSAARAKAMAAPVYTATLGTQVGVEDLAVRLGSPQELAFAGQQVPVVVSLRHRGSVAGPTTVSLVSDGRVVEQRQVTPSADGQTDVVFEVARETPGLYRYEVRAEKLPGEVTDLNNMAPLLLRVVDEPVRVLLLEGKPYWDTKFLTRTLAQDASVELVSIVQLREGRFLKRLVTGATTTDGDGSAVDPADADATGAADETDAAGETVADDDSTEPGGPDGPAARTIRSDEWSVSPEAANVLADPAALAGFQVVVLGRDADVFLGDVALANLKKWLVEDDGSLVCFRGPPASQISQRLGELMPVRWSSQGESRFRMQFTEAGRALRWLVSSEGEGLDTMPSLATSARAEGPKSLAVVLAEAPVGDGGPPQPVISYQPVGTGRVVVVEGAGMWRWAFLPPEYQQHDDVYATLWRSLVRWLVANVGLMPSQEFALRVDQVTFSTGETPTATLLVREDRPVADLPEIELSGTGLDPPARLTPLPSGSDPGQFRVVLDGPLPAGSYRMRLVGVDDEAAAAAFDVRGNLDEQLDIGARPDIMAMIAERSGGAVLDSVESDALARQFDEHLLRSRPERTLQTIAWDRWWVLTGALCLWATAWGLRRRWGLV